METEAETHTQTLDGGQGILMKRGRRIGGLNDVKGNVRKPTESTFIFLHCCIQTPQPLVQPATPNFLLYTAPASPSASIVISINISVSEQMKVDFFYYWELQYLTFLSGTLITIQITVSFLQWKRKLLSAKAKLAALYSKQHTEFRAWENGTLNYGHNNYGGVFTVL